MCGSRLRETLLKSSFTFPEPAEQYIALLLETDDKFFVLSVVVAFEHNEAKRLVPIATRSVFFLNLYDLMNIKTTLDILFKYLILNKSNDIKTI